MAQTAFILALLAVAAVVATVAVAGRQAGAAGTSAQAGAASSARGSDAPDPTGRRVYLRDCAWCHGVDGGGTNNGPTLKGVGPAAADFYLRTGRMPLDRPGERPVPGAPEYPSKTISALVAYVGSLGPGEPLPRLATGDAAKGRTLFLQNCAPCHSSSGTGMITTDGWLAPKLWSTRPEQVAEAMRIGPGPMPEFSRTDLDDKQLNDIVTYVGTLGSEQVIGGNGLDQFGPIAEMFVVLLVLLPVLLIVIRLLGKKAPK
ncbi:c-type cytochrome [Actinopolymorpha singaporensis]